MTPQQAATTRPVVSPVVVVGGLTGCALVAAGLVAVLARFAESVVWQLALVVASAAVSLPVAVRLVRWLTDRPYRHNELHPVEGEVGR